MPDTDDSSSKNVNRSLVSGSLWMVAMRWAMRGIGLANTLVLARILRPEDFGLIATAMLLVGLVEAFGQTGQLLSIIRHKDPTPEHFDTAWSISIILGIAVTAMLLLSAPLAGLYFNDPRSTELVMVLSLRALVGGFENTGVVVFRRSLQFSKEFNYQIMQKIVAFVVTIACAVIWRDFWALVLGILASRVATVILSYMVQPYRPRFRLTRINEIWSFSAWMLVVNVGQYMQDKIDAFAVGGTQDTEALGEYSVTSDIATAPTIEVVLPMARAFFPIFARLTVDTTQLRDAFLNVFAVVVIICCSTSTGVAVVARDFIAVALGPQWANAEPLCVWLAFGGGFYGITQASITLFSAVGTGRTSAYMVLSRLVVGGLAVIAAAWFGTTETVAMARMASTGLLIPGMFFALSRILPITAADLLSRCWRPIVASAVMAAVVKLMDPYVVPFPVARLAIEVFAGATSFTAGLLALWWMSGRPESAELSILRQVTTRLKIRADGHAT